MRFWDSSALVPLIVEEERSAEIAALGRADPGVVIWWGAGLECTSAIRRREREGVISAGGARNSLAALDRLLEGCPEVLPSVRLRSIARRLLAVHPLRAADACQLAAAMTWRGAEGAVAEFVCLDERLADAASREGFRTSF